MNNIKQAEEKVVEVDTTQDTPPVSEDPITGDQTTLKESDDQGSLGGESDVKFQSEEERKAFQEMRLENKRLKERIQSVEGSAFDAFKPQTPPVNNADNLDYRNFQDPITGEVNWQAYNLSQQQREQNLIRVAEYNARQVIKDELDEQNARNIHPELFADKRTEKLMAAQWLYEKSQGNNVSVSQIAEEFARNSKQALSKAEKIGAEKILNEVTEKEQATFAANSQTSSSGQIASAQAEHDELVARTRYGNEDAIVARLSKIPWANK